MKKMMFMLTILGLFTSAVATAQGRTITGKVTSADDGSDLPGVNVLLKGTQSGTVTNASGTYTTSPKM